MGKGLFEIATKELSQDAVIASILDRKDEVAEDFIRDMLKQKPYPGDEILPCPESFHIQEVIPQRDNIDIFVEIESDEGKYGIIIEDKTDSELHDQQTTNYISTKINEKDKKKHDKYDGIFYVFFKTGPISFWELDYYIEEVEAGLSGKFKGRRFIKESIGKKRHREIFFNQVDELRGKSSKISYSIYVITDFLKFIKNKKDILRSQPDPGSYPSFLWIDEYYKYLNDYYRGDYKKWITKQAWRLCDIENQWKHNGRNKTYEFMSNLTGIRDISCYHVYNPGGQGEKKKGQVEFSYCGIAGKNVLDSTLDTEKRHEGGFKDLFVFPIILRHYKDEDSVIIRMTFQLWWNPNDHSGYYSKSDLRSHNAGTERIKDWERERNTIVSELRKKKNSIENEIESKINNSIKIKTDKEASDEDVRSRLQLCSVSIPLEGKSPDEVEAVKICFRKFIELAEEFKSMIEKD